MLAEVVVFANVRWQSGSGRSQEHAAEGETGDVLKYTGVLHGFRNGLAPGKRSMAGHQNSRNRERVEFLFAKAAHDDCACVPHVRLCNLLGGQGLRDRDRAMKIVGVSGAEARDRLACLRP